MVKLLCNSFYPSTTKYGIQFFFLEIFVDAKKHAAENNTDRLREK